MILELLVVSGVVGAASLVARRLRRRSAAKQELETPVAPSRRAEHTLAVSDVVLYLDREFWLSGCVALTEEGESVARLFRAPAAEPIEWVAELGRAKEIVLFSTTTEVPSGRVGDELPIGERNLKLTRRGHADVQAEGEQVPAVSPHCEFALMGDSSGRRLLVMDEPNGTRWTLLGETVGRELLDILPGSLAQP